MQGFSTKETTVPRCSWVVPWVQNSHTPLYSPSRCPQANLLRKMRLSGIVTQGARRVGKSEYIRAYKVAYSLDGREFTFCKDEKQDTDKVGWVVGLCAPS